MNVMSRTAWQVLGEARDVAPGFALPPLAPGKAEGLRVALFSGNYNIVRDGANKALNRLVRHLLDNGAEVRVYSPTVAKPAFAPQGDLVSVPSWPIPRRPDYKLAKGLPEQIRADIRRFAPNVFHVSAPDILGTRAITFARELGVPVVSSMHTRFETYFEYYGVGFVRPLAEWHLKRFYGRSDYVLAPNELIGQSLKASGWAKRVRIWSRGVDRELFNPARRDAMWRRSQGIADGDVAVLFFGRLVLEKGLDVYEAVMAELATRGRRVKPLVVGAGPAGEEMAKRMPGAVFTGHLEGASLARAVASADILVNPSVTEAFGNVNLEAMASGLAVVSADVPSAQALITPGRTGLLVEPGEVGAFAGAVEQLLDDPEHRRRIAHAGAEAAQGYDWDAVLDSVIDTYRLAGAVPASAAGQRLPSLPRRCQATA